MKSLAAILVPAFDKVENSFDIHRALNWMEEHWRWSIYCSCVYLLLIFAGHLWMKNRSAYSLCRHLILWNVSLALFSFIGMSAVLPNLISNLYNHGITYTTCHSDCISPDHRHLALWGWLFGMSKIFEFGDTLFIVLRKGPLSFLHVYHHVTVCVFTWYALTPKPSALSTWLGGMNYTVHTLMYTYYALKASGFRPHPFVPKVITMMQLSQMFVGVFVIFLSWQTAKHSPDVCLFRYDLFYLGGIIYTSYAILFINFFYHRYIKKTPPLQAAAVVHQSNGTKLKQH